MNKIAALEQPNMQKALWNYSCRLELPSSNEFVGPVMSFFCTLLENTGIEEMEISNVVTAIIEAMANAVNHGNHLDPAKKTTISVSMRDTALSVEIQDEGDGFDLHSIPDPTAPENLLELSGRGIFLIKTFMDTVTFDFTRQGTRIIMEKTFLPQR
jgi:serine/threonine-protein kinase RsbW